MLPMAQIAQKYCAIWLIELIKENSYVTLPVSGRGCPCIQLYLCCSMGMWLPSSVFSSSYPAVSIIHLCLHILGFSHQCLYTIVYLKGHSHSLSNRILILSEQQRCI